MVELSQLSSVRRKLPGRPVKHRSEGNQRIRLSVRGTAVILGIARAAAIREETGRMSLAKEGILNSSRIQKSDDEWN
jgi:hypothetical protein